jgi:hypothetical protein
MTVKNSKIQTHIEAVELTGEIIEVKLNHGARLIDGDPKTESRRHLPTVDFFIKPYDPEGADNDKVVVRRVTDFEAKRDQSRQERFRADASRWGPVRDRIADTEELEEAQGLFNLALGVAERVIGEFAREVEAGRVIRASQGMMNFVKLSYTSPRGERMSCTAYYANGATPEEPRRLVSFAIDDTLGGPNSDRVRIDVSDPAFIHRLRDKLEPVIQKR